MLLEFSALWWAPGAGLRGKSMRKEREKDRSSTVPDWWMAEWRLLRGRIEPGGG